MTDEERPAGNKRPAPGKRISIALAVAVHLALAIFLIYGVRWQSEPAEVVEVDLVRAVPTPAAAPQPAPPPDPKQELKPEPVEKPQPRVAPPPKPDIAIKEKEKPKPPPQKEEPPRPSFNPMEAMTQELARITQRKMATAADAELAQRKAATAAAAHDKAVALWSERIAAKIKHNILRPANASGNPEAVYEITLLPDGSLIGEPRLKQSTGNPALDTAIERAIRKSDPLPKPDDPAVFQRILVLRFRPLEE